MNLEPIYKFWDIELSRYFKSVKGATHVVNPLLTLSFKGNFMDHWMELRANKLIGCETPWIWETNLQPFGANVQASIDIMSAMFSSIY
jgi:hypothetical protein